MTAVTRIETERLLLREPLPGDAEVWGDFITDPDFRRYVPVRISDETPTQRAERSLRSLQERWATEPLAAVGWVVCRRADGQVIGTGGVEVGEIPGDGELDYRFGKPFWGQGYGREAAHAMSRFAIDHLAIERLTAYIVPGNEGSIRIAEGLGLVYEGDVDYMQFFPDPSQIILANPMTRVYAARLADVTLRDVGYRILTPA